MNLFISPHCDDESLFGAYTLCEERDTIQVIIVLDGHIQAKRGEPVTWVERRTETTNALAELGVVIPPVFAGFDDSDPDWSSITEYFKAAKRIYDPVTVYRPRIEIDGHQQHNLVSQCAGVVWDGRYTRDYLTYTTHGKSYGLASQEVVPAPDTVARKHRALSCYASQIGVANCREHFMRDMREFLI